MKKKSELGDRFIEVMERVGHTGYSLSRVLETSEAVISNIRNGKNPPNIQLVCRLLKKYEQVDSRWLLLGQGHMLRNGEAIGVSEIGVKHEVTSVPDKTGVILEERLGRIENLLRRSFEAQVERAILVDESIADLSKRVATVSKRFDSATRDRHDTK